MSAQPFETFLARLYSDREFREHFLESPEQVVEAAGLDEQERRALLDIDKPGLRMAARSYEFKRAGRRSHRSLLRLPWREV
jgi:hypothetical protein